MIISKYIEIKLGKNYINILKKYNISEDYKYGDIINVSVDKISHGSSIIIDVSCDYCGDILHIPYKRYVNATKNIDKYSCSKKECASRKIKDVNQSKYGVDNVFQLESIKDKIKESLIEKYGVEHPMYSDEVKDKMKNTNIERYGVDNYTKTSEYLEKTKKTNLEKYGVEFSLQSEEVRDKGKKTSLLRYGVEYPSQSKLIRNKVIRSNIERFGVKCNLQSEDSKNKIKSTNLSRYGVENPMYLDETKDKIKKTNIERYGVDNYTKTDEYLEKSKKTNLEKYGVEYVTQSSYIRRNYKVTNNPYYIRYIRNTISEFRCDYEKDHNFFISISLYYGRSSNNTKLCTVCNPVSASSSIKEKDLYNYIKEIYPGEVISNYRNKLELDVYLPELNIGFEFNGLYWHSSKYLSMNYHLDKTTHFNDLGIRVFHIFEDDWDYKNDIIKSQISNLLGVNENRIYARKCTISIIDKKQSNIFLDENHIQGSDKNNISIGLFNDEELVSVMTFNKREGRNIINGNRWNLSRFSNLKNTSVIGGFSKLLKYFIKEYKPNSIISYADRYWSDGGVYIKNGFTLVNKSKPDYKYIIGDTRVHKQNFTKSKLGIKGMDITESEYMENNGLYKIYDCGKLKFEIILQNL